MKHIKNFSSLASKAAIAGILASGLVGCGDSSQGSQSSGQIIKQNATVFIEKTQNGYKIADEFPSNETRVFLREKDENGVMNERLLTQAEMDALMREENAKIEAGTSALTNGAQLSSGGMSLGEAILASAAGAIIGSWIGSKLFNSPGYNAAKQGAYSNPSAYSRSQNSFKNNAAKATNTGKSGFFGGNNKATGATPSAGG